MCISLERSNVSFADNNNIACIINIIIRTDGLIYLRSSRQSECLWVMITTLLLNHIGAFISEASE